MQQQFYEPQHQYEQPEAHKQEQRQQQQYQASSQPDISFVPRSTRQSTWLAFLYLLTALPLGTLYFSFLVAALSTGFSLLVVWVGLPLLYITLLVWLRIAEFERQLTMNWLQIYIPPMSSRSYPPSNLWQSIKARVTNPVTWKSLCYLFAKFPFGIFSFTLVISLFATAFGLILMPIAYLVDTLLVSMKALPVHTLANVAAYQILGDGQLRLASVIVLVVGAIIGIVLFVASRYVVKGLAFLWGEFARVMLSSNSAAEPLDASLL